MVLTAKEVRRLDLNAEALGVPVVRLMENAGRALAQGVQRELRRAGRGPARGARVVLFCGKGNNGGDGFAAAAELLAQGVDARVVLVEPVARVRSGAARHHLGRLPSDRVEAWRRAKPAWRDAAVLVDCLLGVGATGAPRPPYDAAIGFLNAAAAAGVPVVSCDVPSGLGSPLSVRPRRTVTLHDAKEGMDAASCGTIDVAPIGIPRAAATDVGFGDLAVGYPPIRREGHKGQHGRVLVVGGGPYTGAPHYAGMAAYRAGADLVLVAAPDEAARTIASWGPDLLVHATNPGRHLDGIGADAVKGLLPRVDAVVLGCGLGAEDVTREAAAEVLAECARRRLPVVVDADGLDALADAYFEANGARTVLTPHGGEFQDLAGWKPTPANVARYARAKGTVVLRKGAVDAVASPAALRHARGGHPTMTVGGTGDVLAGVVGCLLAKGAEAFDAACAAAYLNKRAGEHAAALRSYGATATDVLEAIPAVLLRLEQHVAGDA